MQREAEENEAAHVGQQTLGGGLRGHAAAHGFASGEYGELRCGLGRRANGSGDRRGQYWRTVGDVTALFHVGKLVAEGGYVGDGEGVGEVGHEGVIHSGAGSVAEDEEKFRFRRRQH